MGRQMTNWKLGSLIFRPTIARRGGFGTRLKTTTKIRFIMIYVGDSVPIFGANRLCRVYASQSSGGLVGRR